MNQPGWYDDPSDPALVRWWDGSSWTSEARPKAAVQGSKPQDPGTKRPKKPFYRRTWVLVAAGVIVLIAVVNALSGLGDEKDEPAAAVAEVAADEPTVDAAAEAAASAKAEQDQAADEARQAEEDAAAAAEAQAAADAAAAAEAAKGTVSQQNAYRSAQSYLDFAAFSRAGLLEQLTSEYGEGYPPEDAEFAVARLEAEGGVDWNAEAAEAAQSYLKMSGFSRQGLLEQLTSEYGEGFTPEQAEYGVSTTGL